ncbi:hypothetical protein K2X05_12185 [bacterium]|nr:hypothetical protein [bacterium]
MKKILLLSLITTLVACQGRDTIVNPHEQKKETDSFKHLNQQSLQFGNLNYQELQTSFSSSKRNADVVIKNIINPLENNIFNLKTLLNPEIARDDFYAWINLYTEALYEVSSTHSSAGVQAKLDQFINLAMYECSANLDNCQLLQLFRLSPNSSRLFVIKANQIGAKIETCIKSNKLEQCHRYITEKYRLLAYANLLDVAATRDNDFLASYLTHANLLLSLNDNSTLHKISISLFITLFQTLESSPEQCDLVKKFNSWSYSKKNSSRQSEISKKLFNLATSCDLYDDKGQLSASFWSALKEIQLDTSDPSTLSFYQRLLKIKQNKYEMEAVRNLGLNSLFTKATTKTAKGSALSSDFYNEYFYVLDRFYNGHILLEDAKQILLGANRDYNILIQTFHDYMKLQTFIKMIDSKQFLKNIIKRNQNVISSEKLFERSVLDSEPLAQEWLKLQDGFNNLFIAVKFAITIQGNPQLSKAMRDAEVEFKNLSQSLKIVVTYPSMLMLAHLVAESQGTVTVRTFWGRIEKSAMTLYQELWSGMQQPWFRFSDDPSSINKFYLLYALDYNLKGNFVLIQKDSDTTDSTSLRRNFFDVLLSKYIGKIRAELEKKYIDEFRSKRTANPMLTTNKAFCSYELDAKTTSAPNLNIPVESLASLIYSGQSEKTTSNYLQPTLTLIAQMTNILTHIHNTVKPRIEYAHQILYVAEQNGLSEDILKEAKAELAKTENLVNDAIQFFASEFKNQKNCFIRMTLVEQYYQYLNIENERLYLAQVHEEMGKILQNKTGTDLQTALNTLNNTPNKYKDSSQILSDDARANFFDFFSSKSVFNYSQYDFLIRLADRLETSGFSAPPASLRNHELTLRQKFPIALTKPLFLERNWTVQFPPNVKDSVFLKDRKADIPLVWTEDREEFIRQGLSTINKKDKSFTSWFMENNRIANFKSLVDSAVYLYAATDASSKNRITMRDVFSTMEEFVNFISLTEHEIALFKDLGMESRVSTDEMKDIFLASATKPGSTVAEVLSESLHPFTYLYDSFAKVLNINNAIFKVQLSEANMMADQPLENAYLFSTILNNDVFKMNFQAHEHLVKKLHTEYKETTLKQINKIIEMRKMFFDKKSKKYSESVFRILDGQTLTLEQASAVSLQDNLIHPQKYSNALIFIREFDQSTKDKYGTGEILKTLDNK